MEQIPGQSGWERIPWPRSAERPGLMAQDEGHATLTTSIADLSKAPLSDVIAALRADTKSGLTLEEARTRFGKFGANALEEKKTSQLVVLLRFLGPIPWMIEAAALMAAIVGDWGDDQDAAPWCPRVSTPPMSGLTEGR